MPHTSQKTLICNKGNTIHIPRMSNSYLYSLTCHNRNRKGFKWLTENDLSSDQKSTIASRHALKTQPTTDFNPLFRVNLHMLHSALLLLSLQHNLSHSLHSPVKRSTARQHRSAVSSTSPNNGNSRAAPYRRDTPHNYTIQLCNSILIQTCTTHTHTLREGTLVTHSPTKDVWKEMPNQKREKCSGSTNFTGLEMKWWMRPLQERGFEFWLRQQSKTDEEVKK